MYPPSQEAHKLLAILTTLQQLGHPTYSHCTYEPTRTSASGDTTEMEKRTQLWMPCYPQKDDDHSNIISNVLKVY